MGLKAWITRNVSNPSQYADAYTSGLMDLTTYLAAAFVAFSGEQDADGRETHEVIFESHFDLEMAGFKGITKDILLLMEPDINAMARERLFIPACRDSAAFLCLYSENSAHREMEPQNAERFTNALYTSMAKRCAGRFGFHPEPRYTFDAIQQTIQTFRSDTVLNQESFGTNDALGKVLRHLSVSPDGRTFYAFVVGSKTQALGCAALYVKVLTDITDNIRRCARDLHW